MKPTTATEMLLFSTVRISAENAAGQELSQGTGFFYNTANRLYVVTNKHVVEGASQATLHMIGRGPDGEANLGTRFDITLAPATGHFIGHPDPAVDIALADLTFALGPSQTEAFWRSIDDSLVATPSSLDDFDSIEPVTFIGYPSGLYDSTSGLPIARRGHSATPFKVDYEGKPVFLIDASVFPGSSGSPVFLVRPASSPDKWGNITLGSGPKVLLVGIVASSYLQRDLVKVSVGPHIEQLLDIGVVFKASAIQELVATLKN
ncbi:S1 family peptidase [Knoellia sp. CPCC 206450]|uniref:S1 family peptidase n=1 Tax=Knoellia tibetensis TaxID=3404798 RepID=UPI003B43B67E